MSYDIEIILKYFNFSEIHTENIRKHIWITDYINSISDIFAVKINEVFCEKCNISLPRVLYKEYSCGVKWNELSCNEILIKNLLE